MDSFRNGSFRARRSPRSSADRPDAVAAGAPLADGGSARSRCRVGRLRLGRSAPLDPRSGHWLDADCLRAGRVVAARRQSERPAAGGDRLQLVPRELRHRRPVSLPRAARPPSRHLSQRQAVLASRGRGRRHRLCGGGGDLPVWRSEVSTIVLAVLLVAVCARSHSTAVGPARRARLVALWAAGGLGLALAGGAAARLAVPAAMPPTRRSSRSR